MPSLATMLDADDAEAIYTRRPWRLQGHWRREHAPRVRQPLPQASGSRATFTRNTIECVWSLFKRGRDRFLPPRQRRASSGEYLDEIAFRYNHRDDPYLFRDTLLRLIDAEPLRYAELTAAS